MKDQMELFNEGGLRDEGGQVEPESGNKVPSGSLKEEVADDIPVMMSEGEFVFPADVVRYIGLETLMKMRQDAKQGLKMMEEMGQMGNSEEATIPDDMPFEMADLIVVSGSKPKKMQSGGLLDDPRFKRPTGGDTPTITDEDKKEMEDALLRTGYGNVVMKRYVNADGDVKYIPFVDGEPQMEIPEGYVLDESAPKTQTNIGGGYTDSGGGGDSGGPASPAPAIGDGVTFEKPKLMVDGKEFQSIDEMDAETLVKYYEQFNSPIYRYAATGAALFFSPIVGLAISLGQSYSNKNSPNGMNAVQQKLMTMNLTKEQRARVNGVYDDIKKRGAGGISSLGKTIFNALGLTSDKAKNEKETAFEKFLRTGNIKGAINEGANAIGANKGNKKKYDDAVKQALPIELLQQEFGFGEGKAPLGDMTPLGKPSDISQLMTQDQAPVIPDASEADLENMLGVSQPVKQTAPTDMGMDEEQNYALVDPRATVERKERVKTIDPKVSMSLVPPVDESYRKDEVDLYAPAIESPDSMIPPVDEDYTLENIRRKEEQEEQEKERRSKKRIDISDLNRNSLGGGLPKLLASVDSTIKKGDQGREGVKERERFAQKQRQLYMQSGPTTGSDDDRDDGGPSSGSSDVFFQNDFQTQLPSYAAPAPQATTQQRADAFTRSKVDSFTSDPDRFSGGFYVGGVPTKPMKPQRLKKGGLAKMKVKPKRMKKGGLASRKK